jgi:preprotein translocase subunit SecB
MKATPSPLKQLNFSVTYLEVDILDIESIVDEEIEDLFADYDLDFTFDCLDHPTDDEQFYYEMTLVVNEGLVPEPGYQLVIAAAGSFMIEDDGTLSENDMITLKLSSGLAFMISSVRAALWNATSMGVFGPYTLPAVDLNELISLKAKESLKAQTKKQKKSPKPKKTGFKGIVH